MEWLEEKNYIYLDECIHETIKKTNRLKIILCVKESGMLIYC